MILTPEWMSANIVDFQAIDVRVPLLPVDPLVYKLEGIDIEVAGVRLVFRVDRSGQEVFQKIETMAMRALKTLKDTPIIGLGLNFSFFEINPGSLLSRCFFTQDEDFARKSGWVLKDRKFVRNFYKDNRPLTITATSSQKGVKLDLNYFYNDQGFNTDKAVSRLAYGVHQHWADAVDMLRRTYGLELESEVTP